MPRKASRGIDQASRERIVVIGCCERQEIAVSSPDSSNRDDSPEADAGGLADAEPMEQLWGNAQILQALTALADNINDLATQLSEVRKSQRRQAEFFRNSLAQLPGAATADGNVPRQVLRMEQEMLWSWETAREGLLSLRLPRPSIIGRALYDLQQAATTTYEGSFPAEIYIKISVNGRHHLSDTACDRVDRYQAGETRAMSGKINEHLEPRFEALSDRSRGRYYAESAGNRRSLTVRGSQVFADWPHWSARDDDLTGDGPGTSSPTPPAGGTIST